MQRKLTMPEKTALKLTGDVLAYDENQVQAYNIFSQTKRH